MRTLFLLSLLVPACIDTATEPADDSPDEITWRGQTYERADHVLQAPVTTLEGKSRAELAELFRPTLLHADGVYTATQPNWEAADAALAPGSQIERTPRPDVAGERSVESDALARQIDHSFDPSEIRDFAAPDVSSIVIGADNRTLSPTALAPFNSIARVRVFTGAGGVEHRIDCTGSFVGQWTFVLAGHCLQFPNPAGGAPIFATRIVVEQARAGASLPFGTFNCNNADAIPGNNFTAGVPAGYGGGVIDSPLNFAVVDLFPCNSGGVPASRRFNGYVVDSGNTTYNMHGYPLGLCPGSVTDGTFMCGMAGFGEINGHRYESQLDGTNGQDGAPWFTTDPTRVAGVHLGYREYHDFGRCGFDVCRRQYARRIDGTMDTFIRSIAFDF